MMDTVLNLGLGDEAVGGLAERTGNERFAWDSYRRFVQMFGNVVAGIDGMLFEEAIRAVKSERGVALDTELTAADLCRLVDEFKRVFAEQTGRDFPQAPREQLSEAVAAVFGSWNGARAIEYRRLGGIPDEWGTAVNVQQMVFGNMGSRSGSGVAFSRDEITGAPSPSGDFLLDAQGEDVVSGTRDTADLEEMARMLPEAHRQLVEIIAALERHFRDMQDVEFTVEEGTLFMLQTRSAKRPRRRPCGSPSTWSASGSSAAPRRSPRSTPRSWKRSCTRPSIRISSCSRWPAVCPPRPEPPRARSCSPPSARSSGPRRAQR